MRLHLVLLALALGCATEDSKTDDTSSNGGGDGSGEDGSGDDGDGGLASLISDVAEMAATIAAQQAAIVQLEMEMAETLRWETVEVTCSEEGTYKDVGLSSVGAVTATAFYKYSNESSAWNQEEGEPDLKDDGTISVYCGSPYGTGYQKYWLVTVGYER
jgi:hypothetical protein